ACDQAGAGVQEGAPQAAFGNGRAQARRRHAQFLRGLGDGHEILQLCQRCVLSRPSLVIGISMTFYDVHFNRSPSPGRLTYGLLMRSITCSQAGQRSTTPGASVKASNVPTAPARPHWAHTVGLAVISTAKTSCNRPATAL